MLVFLERCGEPDNKDLKAEQDDGGDEDGEAFKLVKTRRERFPVGLCVGDACNGQIVVGSRRFCVVKKNF